MTKSVLGALTALLALSLIAPAIAHDGAPHKCKKGYVLTDDHRCVKARP